MPGFLLHQGATVLCLHSGSAQPIVVNPRVKVSGQPIVTQTSTYAIAGCPNTLPSGTPQPCVTASWIVAATRIKANGMPVLLQDSQSICIPTGTGLTIAATQVRVKGM
ncbi:hypothetical protein [Nostoc parmelioides]|uniref:DUF4280 domain-containing protein n=1 Tax=Nostoc parmelioides FACHB-3921 TaxID=2692909 RepID=A0ABR8BHE3_9NOSO|nr:hypothetical protein [Nostoc parmelioides]MBD2253370.1 hypothetical protein [Nostoc parmelioides FACHB-3921]